ncbi:TlpA family protein disulfide reductase [Methylotuvimicrobium buryatense]|uniref:TlpA family protein disulfide reductase n=1 Tax=Methylotuvimicrobium buryatense TaxID=95641 RepID=A0A4P9UNT0_METBY|nr:TlpA disulfide reductase family protein [Methylotuvimicrobium buryatense]QCW82998.1 TlpA family protein disulfide reductase [Methylotuvimicrobium buryatense]
MKQTTVLIIAAAVALASGIWLQSKNQPETQTEAMELPDYRLPDLTGNERSSSEWRGKIVIVNFWATWCPPCREEIPEFIALQQEYQGRGLQFVGIAIETKESVEKYLDFVDINYPMLIAGDQGIILTQQWGNSAGILPFSLIFNQQGRMIHKQAGQLSRAKIVEIIEPLID